MRGIQKCNCHLSTGKHMVFFFNTGCQENCAKTYLFQLSTLCQAGLETNGSQLATD